MSTSGLAAAIFDFRLPVALDTIRSSTDGLLGSENAELSVEILLLSSLQAEI